VCLNCSLYLACNFLWSALYGMYRRLLTCLIGTSRNNRQKQRPKDETKRNETKRNQWKRNETKRNEINKNETKWKRNKTKPAKSTKTKQNTMLDYFPHMSQCLSPGEDRIWSPLNKNTMHLFSGAGFVLFRFHFVSFLLISFRFVSFRFHWFRFVSFRFVSISFRTL
jgi:hypothetical protein